MSSDNVLRTHLSNPANILHSILLTEAQILVQPKSNIVAIQSISGQPQVEQMLLKRNRDGRLARGRETCEP